MKFRAPKAATGALALALVASACAGGDTTATELSARAAGAAEPAAQVATTAPVVTDAPESAQSASAQAAPVPTEPAAAQPTKAPPVAVESEVETPAAPPAATIALPDVEVYDLATGQPTALASFAKPGATLVWFWAPH